MTLTVSNPVEATDYNFLITRTPLPKLTSLTLSRGELLPAFNPTVTSYSVRVANDVTSLTITPVVQMGISITMNDNSVSSGQGFSYPLSLGVNNLTIRVSDSNGNRDYNVSIKRIESPELKSITLSSGTLSPEFHPEVENYSTRVPNSVTSLTVTPEAHSNESITVNGETVLSGNTSSSISLSEGDNTVTIRASSSLGHRDYIVTVYRVPLPILSSITLSSGVLSPQFSSATTAYSVNVLSSVTSLIVTPTATHEESILVNGEPLTSGNPSEPMSLSEGENTIVITVSNGVERQNYNLTVMRAFLPRLSGITLSSGTVSNFHSETEDYSVTVVSSVTSLTVTPVARNDESITVNGETVLSGNASSSISLSEGLNPISIVVSNSSNESKTYTLNIRRLVVPKLSGISVSQGSLSPSFDSEVTSYSVSVMSTVDSITVTPTADSNERIFIGTEVTSGQASNSISLPFQNHPTVINIIVYLGVGNQRTYTLNVTRAFTPQLSRITLSEGSLSPSFNSEVTSYFARVENHVESLKVHPSASSSLYSFNFNITVNGEEVQAGEESSPISLDEGNNTITIVVSNSSQEEKEYTITVYRIPLPKLSGMSFFVGVGSPIFSPDFIGTLNPVFDPDITDYSLKVSNTLGSIKMRVTETNLDELMGITINGNPINSGDVSSAIPLSEGENVVNVVLSVTEETFNTYTITITRKGRPLLTGISLSHGSLSPNFSSSTSDYSVQVENSVRSITVTPMATSNIETITVKGELVMRGEQSQVISLLEGDNTIAIRVSNGFNTSNYILTVNRTPLPKLINAFMSSSSSMRLEPSFDPEATDYRVKVPYDLESFSIYISYLPTVTVSFSSSPARIIMIPNFTRIHFQNFEDSEMISVNVVDSNIAGERVYNFTFEREVLSFFHLKVFLEGLLE